VSSLKTTDEVWTRWIEAQYALADMRYERVMAARTREEDGGRAKASRNAPRDGHAVKKPSTKNKTRGRR
jgi:hypothetical protein